MDNTQQLNAAIQALLTEKTFSVEAMEAVKQMKIAFDEAVLKIEQMQSVIKEKDVVNLALGKVNAELVERQGTMEKREASVAYRELEATKREIEIEKTLGEKDVACANARIAEVKEIVAMVFKNPTVRRSVHESVPVRRAQGNNCGDYVNQENKTMAEEIVEE